MDRQFEIDIMGGRVLRPDGTLEPATVRIAQGRIAEVTASGPPPAGTVRLDATGLLVLPGIVDLHGDAFERQIMPRPKVAMPLGIALVETDRQLVANGICTAFHGMTYSWEPGLRGRASCLALLAALERHAGALLCDTRLHLRFETYNTEAADEVGGWIAQGRLGLLAFNDHLPDIRQSRGDPIASLRYAERSGLTPPAFDALVEAVEDRAAAVPATVARLAAAARSAGLPLLSHDDETPAMRHAYHALGCTIAEFPKTEATARAARALGNPVVMGAPNVIRGGSHKRAQPAAADLVEAGLCTVLASDYYYPALLHAAFALHRERQIEFGRAWRLISANPAEAAGLDDRGLLEPGRRADIVLVDATDPALPRVAGTLIAGRPVMLIDPGRMVGPHKV